MKIACIGNMNNNYFSLMRYLRDIGLDAFLLLRNNEFSHFSPSCDTFSDTWDPFIRLLRWGHISTYYSTGSKSIACDLSEFDLLIGCGTVPAFVTKAGRNLDLFIPYGADLYGFPFMKFPWFLPCFYHFSNAQKRGIQQCHTISFEYTNELLEDSLHKIGFKGKRLFTGSPIIYTPEFNPKNINSHYDSSIFYKKFKKIRDENELVIFHHSRLQWKTSPDKFTWKGNDIFLKGFSKFIHNNKQVQSKIILFEYGSDVQKTKQLLKQLDIEKYCIWFPTIPRKEIMVGISLSDIGVGQFTNSWLSCGTVYEVLAMGKPLLHYREDRLYKKYFPELYPLMNANTDTQVAEYLADYLIHSDYYKDMGERGRHWLQEYTINQPIKIFSDLFLS